MPNTNLLQVQSPWEGEVHLMDFRSVMRLAVTNSLPRHWFYRESTWGAMDVLDKGHLKKYAELFYDSRPSDIVLPRLIKQLIDDRRIEKWMWPFVHADGSGCFIEVNEDGRLEGTHSLGEVRTFTARFDRMNLTWKSLRKYFSWEDNSLRRLFLMPLLFAGMPEGQFIGEVGLSLPDETRSNLTRGGIRAAYEENDVTWEINHGTFYLRRQVMGKESLYELKSYTYNFFGQYKKRLSVSKKERDAPIYGVELELSTKYDVRELIDAVDTIWICAKQDSSITGKYEGKYEMVTLPATLKAHKQLWGKWFAALDMKKFDQTRSTNNGMHVHVSKESFNDQRHQRDFSWFFTNPMCSEFMINFSERGRLNDYCRMPNWNDHGNPGPVKTRKDITRYLSGMRGAINIGSNKGTIEVRLFKGIVSYATVLKNLELVDAVFHFTANGVSYSCNPMREFFNWLRGTNKNQYEALKEYITKFVNEEDYTLIPDISLLIQKYGNKSDFLDRLNALHEDKLLLRDVLEQLKFRRKVTLDIKLNKLIWRDEKPSPRENNTGALMESDSKYLNRFTNKPKKVA